MGNFVVSTVRTAVPALVGLIVSWLATFDISVPASVESWLIGVIVFVAALLWYVIVRALEEKWPKVGVLLGVPRKPEYAKIAKSVGEPTDSENVNGA